MKSLLPVVVATVLLIATATRFVLGDSELGVRSKSSVANIFESKAKNMREVATELSVLHEKDDLNIWGLAFSPNGKYLAASSPSSHEVHIWDWQNQRLVRTLEKISQGASDLMATEPIRYSPDGRLLANCHRRAKGNVVVRIWNPETGEIVHDIVDSIEGGDCSAIGFTPDGGSLIRTLLRFPQFPGNNVIVYSTTTWLPVWGLRTVPFQPTTLAISPDGNSIALGGSFFSGADSRFQSQIRIVSMETHSAVRTIDAFPSDNRIERLAWSPHGNKIAAGSIVGGTFRGPDAVKIFNVKTGDLDVGESAELAHIRALRYSPDGRYLIESGILKKSETIMGKRYPLLRVGNLPPPKSWEYVVEIWDGDHHELLQEIPGQAGSLAVSSDGRYLAMGGDGVIFIWQLR
mgnify:CR=1 FL=1